MRWTSKGPPTNPRPSSPRRPPSRRGGTGGEGASPPGRGGTGGVPRGSPGTPKSSRAPNSARRGSGTLPATPRRPPNGTRPGGQPARRALRGPGEPARGGSRAGRRCWGASFRQRLILALPALVPHPAQEGRVAQQVAAPHPPRLDGQPEDPLEPVVGEPVRRAGRAARDVVEQGAHRPDHAGVDPVGVAVHPELLLRGAHAHEQDVGRCSAMCSSTRSEWGPPMSK